MSNIELAKVSPTYKSEPFSFNIQRANLGNIFSQVLVQAGAPINQKADGTFFHPKYGEDGNHINLNQIQTYVNTSNI